MVNLTNIIFMVNLTNSVIFMVNLNLTNMLVLW